MTTRTLPGFFLLAFCAVSSCSSGRLSSRADGNAPAPAATATALEQGAGAGPLRLVNRIQLPQVRGRIDHMAVDLKGQRLFVAALGNNTLEVVDLKRGERVTSISGFDEPQGLVYMPESGRLFVAAPVRGDRAAEIMVYQTGP